MSLTAADVRRIAQLARLELSEADAQHTLAQLNDVFGLIEALRAVDTTGVEPMTHAQDMTLRLRPDEVAEPDRRDDYQRNAPAVEQGSRFARGTPGSGASVGAARSGVGRGSLLLVDETGGRGSSFAVHAAPRAVAKRSTRRGRIIAGARFRAARSLPRTRSSRTRPTRTRR